MSALSDYLENKIVDFLLRGQSFPPPTNLYFGLLTVAPTDAGGGTEVSGGSYARVNVAASLANFAGTQAAGSTTASSGNTGATSNNVAITYPAPTANWGTCVAVGVYDASSGGNLLFHLALTTPKTVNNGDAAPSFGAGAFVLNFD